MRQFKITSPSRIVVTVLIAGNPLAKSYSAPRSLSWILTNVFLKTKGMESILKVTFALVELILAIHARFVKWCRASDSRSPMGFATLNRLRSGMKCSSRSWIVVHCSVSRPFCTLTRRGSGRVERRGAFSSDFTILGQRIPPHALPMPTRRYLISIRIPG